MHGERELESFEERKEMAATVGEVCISCLCIIIVLQRLPLTRAPKGFFIQFKPAFWWTSINRYHSFSRVGLEKILSPFIENSEEYVGVSAVFATFCCRI